MNSQSFSRDPSSFDHGNASANVVGLEMPLGLPDESGMAVDSIIIEISRRVNGVQDAAGAEKAFQLSKASHACFRIRLVGKSCELVATLIGGGSL